MAPTSRRKSSPRNSSPLHFHSQKTTSFFLLLSFSRLLTRSLALYEAPYVPGILIVHRFQESLVILPSIARKTTFKSLSRVQILINTAAAAATKLLGAARLSPPVDGPNYAWNFLWRGGKRRKEKKGRKKKEVQGDPSRDHSSRKSSLINALYIVATCTRRLFADPVPACARIIDIVQCPMFNPYPWFYDLSRKAGSQLTLD